MASLFLDAIRNQGKNKKRIGELNDWNVKTLNLGAIAETDLENYSIVELGFNEAGERTCKLYTAGTPYLLCAVEDYVGDFETISSFYVGKGERVRVAKLEEGFRFAVTKCKLANEGKAVKEGQKVHFDKTENTYVISNDGSDHEGYAAAEVKLVVVKADAGTIDGQQKIRFEVVEA